MKTLLLFYYFLFVAIQGMSSPPPDYNFTGVIKYSITSDKKMTGILPELATYTLSGSKMRIDMTPNQFEGGEIIIDHQLQTMRLLVKYAGKGYQIIQDDELQQAAKQHRKITYTNQQKTIAGYVCRKAIIEAKDAGKTEVWYSEKIKSSNINYLWGDLKGFPLEFTTQIGADMPLKYTCLEVVETKPDPAAFAIPPDYEAIKAEQLIDRLMKEAEKQSPKSSD